MKRPPCDVCGAPATQGGELPDPKHHGDRLLDFVWSACADERHAAAAEARMFVAIDSARVKG